MKKVGLTAAQSWAYVWSCYAMHYMNAQLAYLAMMKDFRAGRPLPAVGDWKEQWRDTHPHTRLPPMCPADWTPRGASFSAIMAAHKTLMAYSKGELRLIRALQGERKPSAELERKMRRLGLIPGAMAKEAR